MTHVQTHEEALAAMRASIEAALGPDEPVKPRKPKDDAKPVSKWWGGKHITDGIPQKIEVALARIAELHKEPPSPALSDKSDKSGRVRRRSKLDRNERAKAARLLESYNRRTREIGSSGRRNQGALKASGVDVGKELLFGFYNPETGQLDPSDDTIAKATGWSARTVQRARERLRASGLLSWFRRSKWTPAGWKPLSNRYVIGQLGPQTTSRNIKEWGGRGAEAMQQPLRDLMASICPQVSGLMTVV